MVTRSERRHPEDVTGRFPNIRGLKACAATEDAVGGVYSLRDAETGEVLRTGRSVNLAQRAVQHANDPVLGDLEFQVEYRTDDYAEQRGLEQLLYDQNPSPEFRSWWARGRALTGRKPLWELGFRGL